MSVVPALQFCIKGVIQQQVLCLALLICGSELPTCCGAVLYGASPLDELIDAMQLTPQRMTRRMKMWGTFVCTGADSATIAIIV